MGQFGKRGGLLINDETSHANRNPLLPVFDNIIVILDGKIGAGLPENTVELGFIGVLHERKINLGAKLMKP